MNSISAFNNSAYLIGSVATDVSVAGDAVSLQSDNVSVSSDSVALHSDSEAIDDGSSTSAKPAKTNFGYKLVSAAATHPKITAAVVGAAAVAVAAPAILNGVNVGQAAGLARDFVVMTGAAERFQTFSTAANMVGASAAAGALVGASGMAWMASYKSVAGAKGVVEGVKDHDALKVAKGVRKASSGVKKGLTAGAVASLGLAGTQGVAGAARTLLSPAFKTITTVLHTGVGAVTLANGIKNKDKKAIVDGATSIALGVTTGVAMAVGCVPVAVACTVCSVARDGYETANSIMTGVKIAREAKAQQQEQLAGHDGATEASAETSHNANKAQNVDISLGTQYEADTSASTASTKCSVDTIANAKYDVDISASAKEADGAKSVAVETPDVAIGENDSEAVEVPKTGTVANSTDDFSWLSPELLNLLNSDPSEAMFVDG